MKYTCIMADPNLAAMGFSTVVAELEPRRPIAAFVSGTEASAYCDKLNTPERVESVATHKETVSVNIGKPSP